MPKLFAEHMRCDRSTCVATVPRWQRKLRRDVEKDATRRRERCEATTTRKLTTHPSFLSTNTLLSHTFLKPLDKDEPPRRRLPPRRPRGAPAPGPRRRRGTHQAPPRQEPRGGPQRGPWWAPSRPRPHSRSGHVRSPQGPGREARATPQVEQDQIAEVEQDQIAQVGQDQIAQVEQDQITQVSHVIRQLRFQGLRVKVAWPE